MDSDTQQQILEYKYSILTSCCLLSTLFLLMRKKQTTIKFKREYTEKKLDQQEFDFIVVGSGASGCLVAQTLAKAKGENGERFSVLLIEAGEEINHQKRISKETHNWPGLFFKDVDWDFSSEPQQGCNGRRLEMNKGKGFGGSSSTNASVWVRGCQEDFNRWEEKGNKGWDFKSCLPYFKEIESISDFGSDEFRGRNGPIKITQRKWPEHEKMVNSLQEFGIPKGDYNDPSSSFCGLTQQCDGANGPIDAKRGDAFTHFIEPILESQKNGGDTKLYVLSRATTKKINFDQNCAKSVIVDISGKDIEYFANKEIIMSAGSMGSPQILMLSGIGPKNELSKHQIPILVDSPVGENCIDHISSAIVCRTNQKTKNWYGAGLCSNAFYQSSWSKENTPNHGTDIQITAGSGGLYLPMLAANITRNLSKLIWGEKKHDIQHYTSIQGRIQRNLKFFIEKLLTPIKSAAGDVVGIGVQLVQPHSKGTLTLSSTNIFDHPKIDPNVFAEEEDIERLIEGLQNTKKIVENGEFSEILTKIEDPKKEEFEDPKKLEQYIRNRSFLIWHTVGTCKMGINPKDSVVDPNLKVYGIQNLRVIDASIMPDVISGNTYWTSMMIGLNGANRILSHYNFV